MKLAKISILILVLSLVVPGTALGGANKGVVKAHRGAAEANGSSRTFVSVSPAASSQTVVVRPKISASASKSCVVEVGGRSMLQGSIGLNLFSGTMDCPELKVLASQPSTQDLVVKSQPSYASGVMVKAASASIQNAHGFSSLPEARPVAPVPLVLVFTAVASYEVRRLVAAVVKDYPGGKLLSLLSLERLQVYRC